MSDISSVNLPFLPAGGLDGLKSRPFIKPAGGDSGKTSFDGLINTELNKLKFSGHAKLRLELRELELSGNDMVRLENAVSKAELKGSRESLIMLDDKAFIVSVPNKTVITALSKDNMRDNVVTNIDSAVIA